MQGLSQQVYEVEMGDDGMHKPTWLRETFLDMREDLAEANALGLRLALIVEQRGCIYCKKMHTEIFPIPEIDTVIRENYFFVQINMFGDLEITDFDGEVLPERDMVKKWGVFFTPTILFMPEEAPESGTVSEAAVAVMPGAFGKFMTLNMFNWVLQKGYDTDEHFQKYHARMLSGQLNR
ncbi:MAG: thioredoxin family protein [Rhodobacteraceae bacterium]|nr:thioredoxin family protein [Paracoccaceae bacterium]